MRAGSGLKTQTKRLGKTIAQGWTIAQLSARTKLQNTGAVNTSTSVSRFHNANTHRLLAKAVTRPR